jgi:hypothetical protein
MAISGTLQKIGGFGGFALDAAQPQGLLPTVNGIVATNGGSQTSAGLLTGQLNRITVCNSSADAVILPFSAVGLRVTVINAGAAPAAVFPQNNETINLLSLNAAFTLTNNKTAEFYCALLGQWNTVLTA